MKSIVGLCIMAFASLEAAKFSLTGSFKHGQPMPIESGWKSGNVVPKLSWSNAPKGTLSFALICDDPDVPTPQPWVHWVIFNIPATESALPSGVKGSKEGVNSYGTQGYGGPYPPIGQEHRYSFKLFALNKLLKLQVGSTRAQLEAAIKGHILATAELRGTYRRTK